MRIMHSSLNEKMMTQARTYQAYHTIATTTARVQLSSPGKERGGEGREWLAREVCVCFAKIVTM